jgi:hypothetical protein
LCCAQVIALFYVLLHDFLWVTCSVVIYCVSIWRICHQYYAIYSLETRSIFYSMVSFELHVVLSSVSRQHTTKLTLISCYDTFSKLVGPVVVVRLNSLVYVCSLKCDNGVWFQAIEKFIAVDNETNPSTLTFLLENMCIINGHGFLKDNYTQGLLYSFIYGLFYIPLLSMLH